MANTSEEVRLARAKAELAEIESGRKQEQLREKIAKLEKSIARRKAAEKRDRLYAGLTTAERKLIERGNREQNEKARQWIRTVLVEIGKVNQARALQLIPPLPKQGAAA